MGALSPHKEVWDLGPMLLTKRNIYIIEKRILRYIKDASKFGLFYSSANNFDFVEDTDSDWTRDFNDRKSTTRYIFLWATLHLFGRQRSNLFLLFLLVKLNM